MTNCLDLLSDNNKKYISLKASNYAKERIRPVDNNNKNIKSVNIN